MTNAFDSMDLNTAYEIAGGYIEADDEIFAKALEMVKADDARFAEELKAARKAEISLKAQQDKEEEIAASAEEVLDNTSFLKQEFGNDKFQQDFFADEEIKAAEKNTPVYDINPETQERFELEGDDKHAHFEMLFEKAKLDVWREQAGSKEFHNLKNKDKKKSLFAAVKNSFLSTVAHLRTSAQIEREVPDAVHAVQKEDKNFFAKQAGSMLSKIQNALNPDKEIKISSSSVMAACAESEARTNKFARKLADLAKKATGKKKECFSKAALMTHKAKEAFAEKAKLVWGQRYEFMANIRDRAPKIVTDMAATGVLVGATALSAPWLGTAVIGYGAYKAASAWVWPIVTHARKEARLAQKDAKAPKMKFWDRLKKSADTVTSSKEYYKEAGWGCAAGLLGLGAAGIASGAGANVLLQKSFQRLSSTAVYTANSLTNAVKKLKEKDGNWWGKGMAVASTMVMAYVLTSCGENTEETLRMPQNNGGMPDLTGDGNKTLAVADTTNTVQRQTVQAVVETTPTISVPENWESNMGITENQWERLQSFWGSKEQYETFYKKISDDMLEKGGIFEGMTREQVLFKYERLSSWNLTQHQEVIRRMDSFFGCDGEERIMLTADDAKSLDDVLSNGAIRDVDGTKCIRTTGIDINCGEEAVRHDVRVDCGCDENVPANHAKTEKVSVQAAQDYSFEEVPGSSVTVVRESVQENANGSGTGVKIVQANNLNSGKVIGETSPDAVSGVKPDNVQVVIGQTGDGIAEERTGVAAADGTSTSGARAVAEDEFTFTEIPGTTTQVTDSSSVSGETITLSDKSDATAAVLTEEEYTFEEVQGSSRVVTPETGTEIKSSGLRNEDIMQTDAPAAGVTEQIVADSDEIAAGTPAADNVPERGGYQNTGLTEAQYHRTETFFKNKSGENAFDDYMNRITDDMRAKGGMFEGLSKAQALYSVQQMTAWSNDQHGAFAKEISTMIEYLKGECKDTITVSESGAIKTVIDKVNENGTIDGVTGSTNKVVRYFQANDCGEHGTYAINETTATSEITQPSGNKFKRFFKKMWNTSPEPVFEEIEGTSRVVERVQVAETVVDPQIKIIQANNLDEGKVIGTANTDDISSVRADNVEVVIGSEQAPTEVSANEAAAEEAKRRVSNKVGKRVAQAAVESGTLKLSPEAAAALRESGRDPSKLTNPALIKWANETYKR